MVEGQDVYSFSGNSSDFGNRGTLVDGGRLRPKSERTTDPSPDPLALGHDDGRFKNLHGPAEVPSAVFDGCADGLDAFEGSGDLALLRENLVEFFLCAGHRLAASSEEPVPRHPRVVVAAIAAALRLLLRLRTKHLPHALGRLARPVLDVFAQRANLLPDVVNLAL